MKKIILGLLFALVITTGCEKIETVKYKQGTYQADAIDNYNNQDNISTATVTISEDGKILSVYLDTTYTTSEGVKTTKKTLGYDYNMKKYNPNAAGEWFEQVEKLEQAIVENQGTSFLNLKEDGKTDAVTGCTMAVNSLVEAVNNALNQARQ